MRRARSDGGFTLVEALVSLFIFSLISAGCVAMLMQSVDSQRRVGEAQDALRQVQTARALFESDLQQIAIRNVRDADGTLRPAFIGGDANTALAFVRASAEPSETGPVTALSFVEYRIEDGNLVRRARSYLDAAVEEEEPPERVVLSGVQNLRFEFFDGAQWREQWLSAGPVEPLPRAAALIFTAPRFGEMRIQAVLGVN